MLELARVTKVFGDVTAVRELSFRTGQGGVLGLLGRNGAGKTTTMDIITGYLEATSGTVLLDGVDIRTDPMEVKRHIGYLPEQPPLYTDMTVLEYLRFVCQIKGVGKRQWAQQVDRICEQVDIADVQNRLIRNLSKGTRQRVGIAQALVGDPQVLIFDEPTVGLDPYQVNQIRSLIKQLGKQHTVVFSSHLLHEVADVCERLVILGNGEIVAQDTLANLTQGLGETMRMTLRVAGPERAIAHALEMIQGVLYVETVGSIEPGTVDFMLEADRQTDVRMPVFRVLAQLDMPLLLLKPRDVTLEELFMQLTQP